MKQFWIALDQLGNTILNGWADETISARSYRNCNEGKKRWCAMMLIVNAIFFMQPEHCKQAYISEAQRQQLPPEYRDRGAAGK